MDPNKICTPCSMISKESWFVVLLVRTTVVKHIPGDFSAVVKSLINVFFDPRGHDFSKSGISLRIHEGDLVRIFASLGVVLADEAALHCCYACKGSSGLKPCMLCTNIFNRIHRPGIITGDATGLAQTHTCHDSSKLQLHTTHTMNEVIRRLVAAVGTMSNAAFNELQTRLGWNYWTNGVMLDARTRSIVDPTEHSMYDWMHCFFVNGVFNVHVGRMMVALKLHGVTYAVLHTYLACWVWPKRVGTSSGTNVCCPKRADASWKDGTLKCTASEGLSLVPVLAHFMESLAGRSPVQEVKDHAACFLRLTKVVELILRVARCSVRPRELDEATCTYLRTFKGIYGEDCMTIKFHYILHFARYVRKWGILPNCFVHERKHRLAKRYGNEVKNITSEWEASVLREITCKHIHNLSSDDTLFETSAGLIEPFSARANVCSFLFGEFGPGNFVEARVARINAWEKVHKGDVVELDVDGARVVGQVCLLASVQQGDESCCTVGVDLFNAVSDESRSAKWRRSDNVHLGLVENIRCALIWSESAGVVTTLKPNL